MLLHIHTKNNDLKFEILDFYLKNSNRRHLKHSNISYLINNYIRHTRKFSKYLD